MTIAGIILFWTGTLWLIALSFSDYSSLTIKLLWTAAHLFLNPIAGVFFYLLNRKGLTPTIVCVAGLILIFLGGFSFFDVQ